MAYRLAIFDFDGTLADSYPWFTSVLDHMAARHNFRAIDAEERESLRGASARAIMKTVGVSTWKLARIAKDFRAMKKDASSGIPLFPGIPEMLRDLHGRGVVLALVSSDTEASVRIGLGPELSALFVHFDCGASLFGKARKFRRVLRKLAVARTQTICIGDEDRDAQAAAKAGIDFGAVTWGYSTPESLIAHNPKLTFATVDDIAGIAG
ncbi:HAD hydrolase-like protein [Phenylobacterium sp.]|uniref:HAD hydrolase-like protein n=1 Tax=Phenylobacterium sp. TaxID=1871053 RepID=UPI00271E8694|nr:HAD hydrolase-like protein [Phenylobacterium sp.]MDO8380132.1 HAD hydrolase-like protein [Phenylobacterium sp.]